MRRSIIAAAALALSIIMPLTVATAANADSVPFPPITPFHNMVGSLDSLELVPGEGIVATGWVFDTTKPQESTQSLQMQEQNPDGSSGWAGWANADLPRPDVAAVYPQAGPNHGYRLVIGFSPAGHYKFCTEATFEVVGCLEITVAPETTTGALESLTLDTSTSLPALRVQGWAADSWGASGGNEIDYTVTGTNVYGGFESSGVGDAYRDRSDIQDSHPGLAGVHGFDDRIQANSPGTYTVCATVRPRFPATQNPVYAENVPADIGCITAHFDGFTAVAQPTLSGAATLGSTLTGTPGSYTPTPTTDVVDWFREESDNQWTLVSSSADGGDYPITSADVGHRIELDEMVGSDGMFGGNFSVSSAQVTIPGVTTSRLSGADRYATAIASSQAEFPDSDAGAPVVYVASGENFPDALSAGPAAAKQGGALLLNPSDQLRDDVAAEIERLHPATIVLVGGELSVSDAVFDQLQALAPTVRIGGADRFAVSRALIDYAFPDGASTAFVAAGSEYADALSAGAAAASQGAPILLADGAASSADSDTRAELASMGTDSVWIVGGPSAVSEGVAGTLGDGIDVQRLSGADRYATAVAVNRAVFPTADSVYLASGADYPDGLSGGVHAGAGDDPLYLSNGSCVPQAVIEDIVSTHASSVVILGGTASMQMQIDDLSAC
jgi:putative cell wall-binding protein